MATILLWVKIVHREKDAVAWMLADRARESMALPRWRAIVISGPRMGALRQCAFAPRLAFVARLAGRQQMANILARRDFLKATAALAGAAASNTFSCIEIASA